MSCRRCAISRRTAARSLFQSTNRAPISGRCSTTPCCSSKGVERLTRVQRTRFFPSSPKWAKSVLRISSACSSSRTFPLIEMTFFSNSSPADFVIDAVSVDYHSVEEEAASKASIDHLVAAWKKEKGFKHADQTAPDARHTTGQHLSAKLRKTPFTRAFPVVLARSFKCACSSSFRTSSRKDAILMVPWLARNLRRQPDVFIARLSNPPLMACLFWIYFAVRDFSLCYARSLYLTMFRNVATRLRPLELTRSHRSASGRYRLPRGVYLN